MDEPKKRPTMYMLAGPNGAGKSTLYETVIKPRISAPFINADHIQKNEMGDPSMQASYQAAKIAEERRQAHLSNKLSFVSESTFSHPSKLQLIDDAKDAGFRVVLYHVNVRSANLSVARVATRVKEGGHDVPEDKIRARYERNQELIKQAALKSDKAFVYDNSSLNKPPSLSISFSNGRVDRISESVPAWARTLYDQELKPFSKARQNAAAASYEDIKEVAKHIAGDDDVKVLIPSPKQKAYEGAIVGESSLHALQQTKDKDQFVAHFKSSLDKNVAVGQDVSIQYSSKYKSHVEPLAAKKNNLDEKISLFDKALQDKGVDDLSRQKIMERVSQKLENNPIKPRSSTPSVQQDKDNDYER